MLDQQKDRQLESLILNALYSNDSDTCDVERTLGDTFSMDWETFNCTDWFTMKRIALQRLQGHIDRGLPLREVLQDPSSPCPEFNLSRLKQLLKDPQDQVLKQTLLQLHFEIAMFQLKDKATQTTAIYHENNMVADLKQCQKLQRIRRLFKTLKSKGNKVIKMDKLVLEDRLLFGGRSGRHHLDIVEWIQEKEEYFRIIHSCSECQQPMNSEMVCRICEQVINTQVVHQHSDVCSERTALAQKLMNLNEKIKSLLELSQKREHEYMIEITLSVKKRSSITTKYPTTIVGRVVDNKRSLFSKSHIPMIEESKNSGSPLKDDPSSSDHLLLSPTLNNQEGLEEKEDKDSFKEEPLPQPRKQFLKRARTVMLGTPEHANSSVEKPSIKVIEDSSDADHPSSNNNYFQVVKVNTPDMTRRPFVRKGQKNLTRSYESSYSPDMNVSTTQLKTALAQIKLIINYCERVLRQESYRSLERTDVINTDNR